LPLIAIAFGWPAVIASIILVLAGIVAARSRFVLAGVLLACPFLLYLSGTPRFGWLAPIVAAFYLGSWWAVRGSRRGVALAMATPFISLAGFLASLVLSQ
jgi:hypothetical protein